MLERQCPMRFRPISGVGNDSIARRVASTVLEASTTAHFGETLRNFVWPFTCNSIPVTVPLETWSLVT